jgi:tRNA-Thr(GGU) m(6)t(6)A37 methyltransferase TsaA
VDLRVRPIGIVRSPYKEKVEAPRQATIGSDVVGTIEIVPELVDALDDLQGFERIWVLFWFDRGAPGSEEAPPPRPKVLPPRSDRRRGVFATRSPHRPNPIGLSAVRLDRVDGCVLHVRDLDILDGTPVLDVKPYLAYADAFPDARAGWLEAPDPRPRWRVTTSPLADEQLAWLEGRSVRDLRERIVSALALGPEPHAYRRIRTTPEGRVLAVKAWRVRFDVEDSCIVVVSISTGYRPRDLEEGAEPEHALHRAFVEQFP